jgi:hypothetical protein
VFDANESTERTVAESIAESISQGEHIEWEHVEGRGADEHETGVLQELHLVDRIAAGPNVRAPQETSRGRATTF